MFWNKSNKANKPGSDGANDVLKGKFVVGNWKCHKSYDEAKKWFDEFALIYKPQEDVSVVVAPTLLCLDRISEYVQTLKLKNVYLAAQDVSPFPRGGYTGAISADMLKGIADFILVGHSERRKYFHETAQNVNNKILETAEADMVPIICVDTAYAMSQLAILTELDNKKVIVGYGPIDALSFKAPETPEKVEEFTKFISEFHDKIPIIYGGSVRADNARVYAGVKGLSGLFVGSASLDAKQFAEICHSVSV